MNDMKKGNEKMKIKLMEIQKIAKELKAENPELKHKEAIKKAWEQMKKKSDTLHSLME